MKIDEFNQKPAVPFLVGGKADKSEPADVHGEAVAKQHAAGDKVELSSYMPVVPTSQSAQGLRINKVEAVKAQMEAGTYQVSSHDVAEKMLAKMAIS